MYVCIFFSYVKVTEWPPIGKIAAHSAYEVFSWYKCLIVSLVFSHLGFWSGSLFLIAPFPDLCLLVLFLRVLTDTVVGGIFLVPRLTLTLVGTRDVHTGSVRFIGTGIDGCTTLIQILCTLGTAPPGCTHTAGGRVTVC